MNCKKSVVDDEPLLSVPHVKGAIVEIDIETLVDDKPQKRPIRFNNKRIAFIALTLYLIALIMGLNHCIEGNGCLI